MKSNKWKSVFLSTLAAAFVIAGCQHEEEANREDLEAIEASGEEIMPEEANGEEMENGEGSFMAFTDDSDSEVILEEQPQRIVILNSEMLKMVYDLEGEAVGRMTPGSIPVPEGAEDIPELGTVSQINTEELTALDPDLVIGSPNFHADLSDLMESNDISFALLQMRAFEDVQEKAALFGEILGEEERAEQLIQETETEMEEIQKEIPDGGTPSVVVLNVTSQSVSVQRANTTAIEIGHLLGVENVGENMEASPDSQTSAPYSLETLAEAQPDYVLITMHGSPEAGQETMEEELEGNPAWGSLEAVENGNVHVIPSKRYLANPGFDYADTMEHMAELVYPEVFGSE